MSSSGGGADDGLTFESSPVDSFLRELAAAPAASPPAFVAGDRLGRFEIVRMLGKGGFGTVYEARDTELARHVAVKVLHRRGGVPGDDGAPSWEELFRQEAAAGARMSHRGLVTVFDFGVRDGRAYLVMELLRGKSLRQRISEGPLPEAEAVDAMIQVLGALAHAHARGVIHRDLKPSNIFLREDGRACVLDFGLARFAGSSSSEPLASAGTPRYMAPAQREGAAQDERTDVFAAGQVLAALLAEPRPDALAPIVQRATRADPELRYQRVEALLSDLVRAQRSLHSSELESEQPFRYLDPFAEADARWFFGRRAETARLARALATRPVLAVVGPSGAGKSSLVHAGLAPRLSASGEWQVVSLRPGDAPLDQLHKRLVGVCGLRLVGAELGSPADLLRRPGAFGTLLRRHCQDNGTRLLVVVDQLEELVTHDVEVRAAEAFVLALLGAADDAEGPIRCVLTGRDDHLGPLARLGGLGDSLTAGMVLLGPPDAAALTEALVGPAARLGFELEEGLAERVVAELADEVAPLPLLQLAASRLWERRDEATRRLSSAALDAAGGVGGVLAAHAEEVLRGLGDQGEVELAMDLLLQLCTADGLRRERDRSELAACSADPAAAARIVDRLVAGRVLTARRGESAGTVEISHESLIRGWTRLAHRLDHSRDARRFRERVAEAATLWLERERPTELLWTGRTLEDALRLRDRYGGSSDEPGEAFLAAAEARAGRRRRVTRLVAAALAVTALVATGASLWATHVARREAEAQRVRSIVQSAATAKDPLLGALLLRELDAQRAPEGAASAAHALGRQALPLAVLRGHTGQLNEVAMSPDGDLVVTASYDQTARVWPADGRGDPLVIEHDGPVLTVDFFACGTRVVSGARDGVTRVSNVADGAGLELRGCEANIFDAVASPDGRWVAAACSDGHGLLWRLGDEPTEPTVLRHEGPVWRVAFSPDSSRVATASADRTARVWDLAGGEPVVLRGHTGTLRTLSFSPSGAQVLTAGDDGTVRTWAVGGGSEQVFEGHQARVWEASFSPDGRLIASVSGDGTARVWPVDGGPRGVLRDRGAGGSVARFGRGGRRVLFGGGDGNVQLLRSDGSGERWVFGGHEQAVAAARFDRSGGRLVTASVDGTARVWSVRDPDPEGVPEQAQGDLLVAHFSADSRLISAGGVDGSAWVWPVDNPALARRFPWQSGRLTQAILSVDGAWLATGSFDHTVRVGRIDGSGPVATMRSQPTHVAHTRLSPDGTQVVAVVGGVATVWHRRGGPALLTLREAEQDARFAMFDKTGQRVVVALRTGPVVIVSASTGEVVHELKAPAPGFRWADLSTDNRTLLAWGGAPAAKLWSLEPPRLLAAFGGADERVRWAALDHTGRRVVTVADGETSKLHRVGSGPGSPLVLRGHARQVVSATFTPDGARVLTVSIDGTCRVFGSADGREQLTLARYRSPLDTVEVSPDGARVLSTSYDGLLHVWELSTWPELQRGLGRRTTACLTAEQRARFLSESRTVAVLRYRSCERAHGRTPQ